MLGLLGTKDYLHYYIQSHNNHSTRFSIMVVSEVYSHKCENHLSKWTGKYIDHENEGKQEYFAMDNSKRPGHKDKRLGKHSCKI